MSTERTKLGPPLEEPGDKLRHLLRTNSRDFGELGRHVRLETVYDILDHFVIVDTSPDAHRQITQAEKVRRILGNTSLGTARQILEDIYRSVFP